MPPPSPRFFPSPPAPRLPPSRLLLLGGARRTERKFPRRRLSRAGNAPLVGINPFAPPPNCHPPPPLPVPSFAVYLLLPLLMPRAGNHRRDGVRGAGPPGGPGGGELPVRCHLPPASAGPAGPPRGGRGGPGGLPSARGESVSP